MEYTKHSKIEVKYIEHHKIELLFIEYPNIEHFKIRVLKSISNKNFICIYVIKQFLFRIWEKHILGKKVLMSQTLKSFHSKVK